MTLVEVSMSMVVLVVAVGGTLASLSKVVELNESTRESTMAYFQAQQMVEQLQAQDFREVLTLYNSVEGDEPAGVASIGGAFDTTGLAARTDDPDGQAGSILLPEFSDGTLGLREDMDLPEFGLPRDLNGDGIIDGESRADDYQVLPVRVRVEWVGRTGNRVIELQTMLRAQ